MDGEIETNEIDSFDRIADALTRIAHTLEQFYERTYPDKPAVREAVVTHRLSQEEALRQSQGATEEDDSAWMGERERRTAQAQAGKERSVTKAGD